MRRTGVIVASAIMVLSAGVSGATAQSPSASPATPVRADWEVIVDGLAVSGHCTGVRDEGEPVVILQAGNGGGQDALRGVEDHLRDRVMVCAFGRPGAAGGAAPAALPRSVDVVVAEVRAILQAAAIEPPFFLVGHSAGGAISFMFAQAFPDDVAGFVDMNGNPPFETWLAAAQAAGLFQEMIDGAVADFSGQNPEGIDFRSNESMLALPLAADLPYAVIYDECGDDAGCAAALAFEGPVFEALAQLGAGGRIVWAKGAGHEVHVTQPELVHRTIDEVWAEATD